MTMTDTETLDIRRAAKLAGVSSRTLRHYDSIGLLTPAYTGHDGRRHYGPAELLRLQHILVLKALGVDLDRIGRIVDTDDPASIVAHLRDHLAALTAERDRFTRLVTTVSRTIESLEKGTAMTADEMLDGFAHKQYDAEARERWGDAAVDRSQRFWEGLGEEGKKQHMLTDQEIVEALGAAVRVKLTPDSPEVQAVAARHYEWVSVLWVPTAEAYVNLTRMYVDDERFRLHYDEVAPGAAALLHEAAKVYAERHLS